MTIKVVSYTNRLCLRCQDPKGFESKGIHNRICKKCKKRDGEKVDLPHQFLLANKPKGPRIISN